MLTKPYLKPGGFSEPVVTMKKLFNSTQTKQTSNTITTLRSKSSLIPKNSEKGSNNFSFEYLNHHIGFMEKPSNLKKSSSKTQIKEKDYGQSENSMIYSIRPDYSKKVLMHSHINQSEYCTERNEKPKHVYGNLSVDNRQKKQQSLNKKLSHKIMEIDQINNNENNYYKENIGLRANIKKLKKELDQEKEKNSGIENELKSMKLNLQNERSKYQRELMKFSEKIKNFKNIQSLYVDEKQNSEKIEKDLIQKESLLREYQTRIDEIIKCLLNHNKEISFKEEETGMIIINTNEKANTIFESFKTLFNNLIEILHPITITNTLIHDLQSIKTIKIKEKPSILKDGTKKINRNAIFQNPLEVNSYTPEKINSHMPEKSKILNKNLEKFKLFHEFDHLDNKLENVNQKIEKEIRKQTNSLDKIQISKNSIEIFNKNQENENKNQENENKNLFKNNNNSFSCISDKGCQKDREVEESEKFEINNTFQIENIDYENFKTNLDKQMEENNQENPLLNINFEQISEINEIKETVCYPTDKEKNFKDPSPSKSFLSDLEGSESKKSFQNNCLKKKQNQEKNSENKENSMVPISENSFNEIAEKNILQEKKLNDNRSNIIQNPIIKKQEIYAIVKFDFSPKKENDLKLLKGNKIQILKKTQNGWWIGMHKNKIGYFPYNYIEIQ